MPPDARVVLSRLQGRTLRTLARDAPNKILRIEAGAVVVATEKSPKGKSVPIAWVQEAINRLVDRGELVVTTKVLGMPIGSRSAFLSAVLRELPGVEELDDPKRLRLRV